MIKTTTNTVLDYSYVSKRMIDIDSRTFKAISDFTNCLHNLCLEYNRNAVVYNIMSSLELLIVLLELIRLSAEEVFGCYIERNIMISEILDKLRLYDESWE